MAADDTIASLVASMENAVREHQAAEAKRIKAGALNAYRAAWDSRPHGDADVCAMLAHALAVSVLQMTDYDYRRDDFGELVLRVNRRMEAILRQWAKEWTSKKREPPKEAA